MCNRYGYQHPLSAIPDEFSDLGPIRWDGLSPNAPLDQMRPTDRTPIIRPVDGALELTMIRWGPVPWFHKGTFGRLAEIANQLAGPAIGVGATRRYLVRPLRQMCAGPNFGGFSPERNGEKTI
jgi:putative SOS response-associated peptidase YedK